MIDVSGSVLNQSFPQLGRTILLLTTLPPGITALLIAFPAFMWVGVTFLLILVKDHGAVAASAANVVRKVIAVAFSFLYFARPVTVPMAIGAAMVFGSIVWRSCVDDHRPVEGNSSPVKMSAQVTPWPGAVNDDTNPEQNPQYAGDDDEENPSYTDNDHDRQESEPLNGSSRNAIARKPSSQTVQH